MAVEIKAIDRTCSKCSSVIKTYLHTAAYSVICTNCGTIYRAYAEKLIDTGKSTSASIENVEILIGSTGKLFGTTYQVIAIAQRKENNTSYSWLEYTLYNPLKGLAFLSVYDGHWVFLTETDTLPEVLTRSVNYENVSYALYSSYTSVLQAAQGEFMYAIEPKEKTKVKEFIIPSEMVSEESSDDTCMYLKGTYVPSGEIKSAFKLNTIAKPVGVGVIQPFLSKFNERTLVNVCFLFVLFWLALQVFFYYDADELLVFNDGYTIDDVNNKKEIYTKAFDIPEGVKNLELKINTNIDNSWMYAGMTLVNESTGDLYDLDLEAEYYRGYSEGEHWTEGKSWMSKVISRIPGGKYYLIIYPEKPISYGNVTFTVSLKRDVYVISNGLILLALLAVFPAFYFYRRNSFERKRWSNSDYSPYEYDE